MPSLLPRKSMCDISVVPAHIQRPSPFIDRIGFSFTFTRLLIGSLTLWPVILLFGNSRPCVTTTPLPHATKAYGQFLGRDFSPLDLLLLLRTNASLPHLCHSVDIFGFKARLLSSEVVFYRVVGQLGIAGCSDTQLGS